MIVRFDVIRLMSGSFGSAVIAVIVVGLAIAFPTRAEFRQLGGSLLVALIRGDVQSSLDRLAGLLELIEVGKTASTMEVGVGLVRFN
jgi:hypothetical protein